MIAGRKVVLRCLFPRMDALAPALPATRSMSSETDAGTSSRHGYRRRTHDLARCYRVSFPKSGLKYSIRGTVFKGFLSTLSFTVSSSHVPTSRDELQCADRHCIQLHRLRDAGRPPRPPQRRWGPRLFLRRAV